MMLLNGQHWLFIGIQVAIMAVCIIINLVMKWWWIKEPLDRPAVGVGRLLSGELNVDRLYLPHKICSNLPWLQACPIRQACNVSAYLSEVCLAGLDYTNQIC